MNKGFYAPAAIVSEYFSEAHAPHSDFMEADEVLSWIAYRKAYPRQEWQSFLFDLTSGWNFPDMFGLKSFYTHDAMQEAELLYEGPFWFSGSHNLLKLLKMCSEEKEFLLDADDFFAWMVSA